MPRSSPRTGPGKPSGCSGCSKTPGSSWTRSSPTCSARRPGHARGTDRRRTRPGRARRTGPDPDAAQDPELRLALEGGFSEHHALLLRTLLDHIDHLTAAIERLDTQVETEAAPFSAAIDLLGSIPGIGRRTAWVIVAEIGTDMSRFPTAAHLASWAGLCPGNHESAGKRRSGRARKGDAALRTALVEAAWAATRTRSTYLGAQYQRFRRRFGTKGEAKAIFAVAHTLIGIIWHVLAEQQPYPELGADYSTSRSNPQAHARRLAHQIEKLGFQVTITPQAA